MIFDVIIFDCESLADFSDIDTNAIRFNGVSEGTLSILTKLVSREDSMWIVAILHLEEQ